MSASNGLHVKLRFWVLNRLRVYVYFRDSSLLGTHPPLTDHGPENNRLYPILRVHHIDEGFNITRCYRFTRTTILPATFASWILLSIVLRFNIHLAARSPTDISATGRPSIPEGTKSKNPVAQGRLVSLDSDIVWRRYLKE